MDKFERVVRLHRILATARRPVSRQRLMDELECSRATLYRTVAFLRDHLGAPLESDEEQNGFYYDRSLEGVYELPGFWLGTQELVALLTAWQVIAGGEDGLLADAMQPLREKIEQLLEASHPAQGNLLERIHLVRQASRPVDQRIFGTLAEALLAGKRVRLRYHGRIRDDSSERVVSPQRLTWYRENWYLDAYCHRAEALRSFAVERIEQASLLPDAAAQVEAAALQTELDGGYGILSGPAAHVAEIRFAPNAARWVAEEVWHPQQQGQWLEDGSWLLRVPYAQPRELLMDVARFGPEAEILSPPNLRQQMRVYLQTSLQAYKDKNE